MLDRTDLQLLLCEQVMDLPTGDLVDLVNQMTGSDLALIDAEKDLVDGNIEVLKIDHPPSMKTWLGFMLYAFGERVASGESVDE